VIFNASSLDARLNFINPDLGQYYQIASTIKEDATLVGSKTMLDAPVEKCEETQEVLKKALEELNKKYNVKKIRVDSGGTLNGILLRNKLVNEINILIQPNLIGGTTPKTFFKAEDLTLDKEKINLKLIKTETLANDVIWVQYKIK